MLGIILILSSLASSEAFSDTSEIPNPVPSPSLFSQSFEGSALGKGLGGSFETGTTSTQATSSIWLKILGAGLQAFSLASTPSNTVDGVTYTEVYSFGKRIFSQNGNLSGSASLASGGAEFTAGIAPVEVRVPVILFPVGPVHLRVDGGARFQANAHGSASLLPGIPISLSSVGVQLATQAAGAGFIEGYASLLVVRAGVGGQVDLVNGKADVNANFTFDGSAPVTRVDAMVNFLAGRFYAFVDYFNFFRFKRLFNQNLYAWKGNCVSSGVLACP